MTAAAHMRSGAGEIFTRRWNDPAHGGDGTRILVCRYRPRGVRREDATWDEWIKEVSPSPELLRAFHGKEQAPIGDRMFRRRYLSEMRKEPAHAQVQALAERVAGGETVTLLCSSACVDESRCHRTMLRELLLEETG
ncbi:DUF488 family protein [Nannocystis sp. ILAH1]|uniref:DUF488 domain-containing protein n=1 Tax=unclassified Nannocystis TaxID=2627009 RepID=UPI0022702F15|nr:MULTISPECIES: DUF488 family protein [unclassified Nannocystis]MCY0986846.1 DUF488 family protein [Nannocystis sp. ILAH1]MCY1071727.1 DUF488 family protein [Nannocystis sp. RBIL2]